MDLDDAQIMRRVQQGGHELFEQLVRRHRDPLVRVAASKLGQVAWAEDVVQETFLAVFAARHTYRPELPFRTWLWTILLNLCRRQLRRQRHRREQRAADTALLPEPTHTETGLSHALLAERRAQVAALLGTLPEAQADALRLRFYGGLKFEEIAQTMGCSLSGAKQRVQKGLLALAERLRDESGDEP